MAGGDGLGRWRGPWLAAVALGAVAAMSLMAGYGTVTPASAHAALERSVPADGDRPSTAPRQVDLYFGQQLVQNRTGTFAVVLGEAGATASDESRLDPQDGKH